MNTIDRRDFLLTMGRCAAGVVMSGALSAVLSGCQGMEEASRVGAALGTASGVLTQEQADAIVKSGSAVARSFQDITPEQAYYIGRAVSAQILQRYSPYPDPAANSYLNTLGQALAQASDLPETFNGYHFLVLDSPDINAFAAPGGLVFVTRGMLACCRSEDAAAAVLAHEIGHVQHRHGLQAIHKQRITEALSIVATEGAKQLGGADLAQLTKSFEGAIGDITTTLVNAGYSRQFESEADRAAVTILERIGYAPSALVDMLAQMKKRLRTGGTDFARTHPDPAERMAEVSGWIGGAPAPSPPVIRQKRFTAFLRTVG
ncbi:MAG: M48 family metalloprotease [Pseudomonadota bacterium]